MSKSAVAIPVLFFMVTLCVIAIKPAMSSTEIIYNSWVSKAPMQQARSGLGVVAVNGKIYAMGGSTAAGSYPYRGGTVGINEEYDPLSNRWTYKTPMPTPRSGFGIAIYKNKIYCLSSDANEVYDPETDTWENKTPMPTPRFNLDANVVDGKIYLIGGYDPNLSYGGDITDVNEVYDPETDTWTAKAPMLAAKREYASAVVGDKIYLIGGDSLGSQEWNLNQIYDTKTDSWSYGAPFPYELLNGERAGVTTGVNTPVRIYVFGAMHDFGEESEYSVGVYNPASDSWTLDSDIPTDRTGFGVAVLDDLFYVIGGVTSKGIPFDPLSIVHTKYTTNERYTPFGYGTIPPAVDLFSPKNQTYNVTSVSLNFTVNKEVSWIGYSLDGQDNFTVSGNATITELADGLHNVTVYAMDEFDNSNASTTVVFSVELLQPEPFPIALVAVVSVAIVAVTTTGFIVYYKKRK